MFSMQRKSRWICQKFPHCSCQLRQFILHIKLDSSFHRLYRKPETSLADPSAPYLFPKYIANEDSADYESELAVVIGKAAKNVSEADAMDYVLGYTAANDISARKSQFAQSQWCFSKGFDGACPIGTTIFFKVSSQCIAAIH